MHQPSDNRLPAATVAAPISGQDATSGIFSTVIRGYQRLLQISLALVPMLAILYVAIYQDQSLTYADHAFHEIAIVVAVVLSGLATYVTWVCYRSSGEAFLGWLTMGLLGFTLLYAPHGIFTRLAHDNLALFVIFGPVSRLAMVTCFLVAAVRFGAPAVPPESRGRSFLIRGIVVFLFLDVMFGAVAVIAPAYILSIRAILESGAVIFSIAAIVVLMVRGVRSPLMLIYLLSMAAFAQSSISFLLAATWNHQWWLAHAISATGFFTLSYGIVRAFLSTKSFSAVYSEEELMERLRRSEEDMRLILEAADEGIFALDPGGKCTLVNRSATRLLGFSPDALLGADIHELVHGKRPDGSPFPEAECALLRAMKEGSVHRALDEVFWRSDETALHVAVAGSPIINDGVVRGMVVSFTDLTQRRSLESQLEEARRLSALGRLASTMAHEVNNVLMAIHGFAAIVSRETSGNATTERALAQITNSVMRGKAVTEQIFQYTRRSPPVFASIEALTLIESVVADARPILGDSISLTVNGREDLRIRGDSGELRTMFLQLIRNACEAIEGEGQVTIDVLRNAESDTFRFGIVENVADFVHFIVTDDGSGMSPETMGRSFEPLFTTKASAIGLGLPLAHQVVTEHGGYIFPESESGRGSSIHVFLPLSTEPDEPSKVNPGQGGSTFQSILLVEDDHAVAAGLKVLLEFEGLMVSVIDRGGEAVEAIGRIQPDAVILDVGLPDMDGTLVYQAIAARWPDLPVLFSTGHADATQLSNLLLKPNVGFLLKPYEVQSVLRWLQTQGTIVPSP